MISLLGFFTSMKVQLKIRQRGLIIVAVPLLLVFGLLASLASLLHQAEVEISQEVHSKEIVMHANKLQWHVFSADANLLAYFLQKDPGHLRRYQRRRASVNEEISNLNSLLSGQPQRLAHMTKTAADVDHLFSVFNRFEKFAEEPVALAAMLRGRGYFREMEKSIDKVGADLKPLIASAEQAAEASPAAQARNRQQIQAVIFGGMLLTVLLAFYLTFLFGKGITSRLQVLTDNAERLAKQLPLSAPLEGSDEIASLDRVFHYMADELAKAAAKEREATERVRLIIASMPVGLLVTDQNGLIDFLNFTTEQMFGYSSSELVGQPISMLFPASKAGSPEEFMKQISAKSTGKISELMAGGKGEREFPVEFTLNEIQMAEGPKLLAIILDITERHEIQKLRQAFVAMVSHDLRTPLASVLGFLNNLSMGAYGDIPEKASKKATVQEKNIERLISLINDLLDLEKIESGVIQLVLAPTSIHSVIQHSVDAVHTLAERNKVKINILDTESDLRITADSDRLVQVLTNLLSNAIKYSPADGAVTVSTMEDPRQIEVRITDCGPGISAQHQEIIFERFQQVESADGIKRSGTGLGLAICKTIVEQHGGSIGVNSKVGTGSEFWFRLPQTASGQQGTHERSI